MSQANTNKKKWKWWSSSSINPIRNGIINSTISGIMSWTTTMVTSMTLSRCHLKSLSRRGCQLANNWNNRWRASTHLSGNSSRENTVSYKVALLATTKPSMRKTSLGIRKDRRPLTSRATIIKGGGTNKRQNQQARGGGLGSCLTMPSSTLMATICFGFLLFISILLMVFPSSVIFK